jgi:hypothetical protein
MRSFLLTAFGTLLYIFSNAQVLTDSTLVFTAYWNKGDVFKYRVNFSDQSVGVTTSTKKAYDFDVKLTVVDSTDTSYTLEWAYTNAKIDNKLTEVEQAFAQVMQSYTCRYVVTEFGDFVSVLNWEEIRDRFSQGIDKIAMDSDLPDSSKVQLKAAMKTQFTTQDQIELFVSQDILQFHYLYAGILNINESETYDKGYVNPFIQNSFSGKETFTVLEIDQKKMTAEVNINAILAEKEAKAFLLDYMDELKVALKITEELTPDMIPAFSISENYNYSLDIYDGIILSFDYVRKGKSGPQERILSYRYTLLK